MTNWPRYNEVKPHLASCEATKLNARQNQINGRMDLPSRDSALS